MERLRADTAAHAVALLKEHGVCWLNGALEGDELAGAASDARERFQAILDAITRRRAHECCGLPEHLHRLCRLPIQSAEAVERDGGRFDIRHSIRQLDLSIDTLLGATLEAALGEELATFATGQVVALSRASCDCLSSQGGDDPQAWHADGPHLFDGTSLPAHALTVLRCRPNQSLR